MFKRRDQFPTDLSINGYVATIYDY